jgi:hypothetical protein
MYISYSLPTSHYASVWLEKLANLSYLSICVDNIVVVVEHKYPSLRTRNSVQLAEYPIII